MLLLQLTKGALVPHAPLLLPELASEETRSASNAMAAAVQGLDFDAYDFVVVVSPHGRRTGVYKNLSGSLREFGYPGIEPSAFEAGDVAGLAQSWGKPLVEDPIDHGVLVPLALHGPAGILVIAVSLQEPLSFESEEGERIDDEARSLSAAIREVPGPDRVLFLASANDSAGLSARAPLTELPGATELRDELYRILGADVGKIDSVALQLFQESASCGLGPLLCLAYLFDGGSANVIAHAQPVGVGYAVAVTDG